MRLRLVLLVPVAVALASALPNTARAQNQVLLGGRPESIGGFGGPMVRVTQIGGETALLVGGGGAAIFNRRFAIGGLGFGGTAAADVIINGTPQRGEIDFGYGGLTLEVITRPAKLVHATFGVMIGGGTVSVWPDNLRPRNQTTTGEAFGAVEPQLGFELNLSRFARVGLNGGYRFTFGSEIEGLVNKDLNGGSGTLVFRFGSF
jgi:hypothetical protein